MRPRNTPEPPASTDDLLLLLRRARLLDEEQLSRLADAWDGNDLPGPHVEQLVAANLLTPYQAEQLLAGRPGRLRLGPYRLLDRLGAGGMGQVFKAEHRLLKRHVALKVLGRLRKRSRAPVGPGATGRETPIRRGFAPLREIETAGRLSHPNIVAAHDACRMGGRLVLVLEYVEGIDLQRLVEETGPLPVDLACEVVRQSAIALDYLHQRGLVHRDVKPANLLLTHPDGDRAHVKLLDLGLACPARQAGQELCGTPDYLAPERGLSTEHTDIRSDLYSLGCTLYHLLTGRVPFPGGNWQGKLLRHRLEVPTPVRDLRPEVPPGVADLVERLMARDPEHRVAAPVEVLRSLEALATPPPPPPPPPRPRRLRRLPIVLATLAILTGAASGVLARLALPGNDSPTERSPLSPSHGPSPVDLVELLAQASDGDVVEIPAGRHLVSSLTVTGKTLTLRGARGTRPVLVRPSTIRTWDAVLQSDRDLTLDGIEVQGGATDGPPAPLVGVTGGKLVLRECKLSQQGLAPALAVRGGPSLEMHDCRVQALAQAVALETPTKGGCRIRIQKSSLHVKDPTGEAIVAWAREAGGGRDVEVEMTEATAQAGRILACRAPVGPVRFRTTGNRLIFHQALVSFDGYRDPAAWRSALTWAGQHNRVEASGPWLRLEGRPGPAWDEQAFERLWQPAR